MVGKLVLALGLAGALPAHAQSLRAQMFPTDSACYARNYSADHLASHPVQRVTGIALSPTQEHAGDDLLVLRVSVSVRGVAERFSGTAYCEDSGTTSLSCGMEGDAGTFSLTPAKNGAVTLAVGSYGVSFEGNSGFVQLDGASGDDRVFLLPGSARCQ